MARRSVRRRIQRKARKQAIRYMQQFALLLLADAEDWAEECTGLLLLALANKRWRDLNHSARYGRRGPYNAPKNETFLNYILFETSDRFFRAFMRMDRDAFWDLHKLIRDNPIFQTPPGRRRQRPSHIQLATFLCYVGGESGIKTAAFSGIAEGTVWEYTRRCNHAIRCLRDDFIAWPTEAHRDWISDFMEECGFPGCVGSADGTYFRAGRKPVSNGYAFYCHKGFYAFVLQASCDHRGLITSYDYGWPGCVQDSRVFRLSHLWQHKEQYFRDHEYILVDKGYPLTKYSIRPFHDHDLTSDPDQALWRKRWNRKLSALRVRIEHVYGRLKGRFPYLRCIPGNDVDEVYKTIEALLILHNFLECRNDNPTLIPEFDGSEADDVEEVLCDTFGGDNRVHSSDDELHAMGVYRRKALLELCINEQHD